MLQVHHTGLLDFELAKTYEMANISQQKQLVGKVVPVALLF